MAEEKISFHSGDLNLEGLLHNAPGERGVVLCHPHPLYGGDMSNNVVQSLAEAYQANNYSTLRFNFRGVGASEGTFDEGKGEQEDVGAALGYLSRLGLKHIDLTGYSFGAWVCALGLEKLELADRLIMVSPPTNFMDFAFLGYNKKIQLVIVGMQDEIAGCQAIEELLPRWNPEAGFHPIDGADHFYRGKTEELKRIINGFLGHAY
ncbi:MAG: alpha/beta hydrolase [Deltaproteobacteria bacterium]|nr:alpha/beta hydrolase [Deltaproteobacteria bacterium]